MADEDDPPPVATEGVTGQLLRNLHTMHREMVEGIRTSEAAEEDLEAETDTDAPEVSGHFTRDSLSLCHSLGYDCTRRNNLHVLDAQTLLYASGNLLHFLDIETGELRFLRTGGGVTAIQVHPKEPLFAVAERGSPPILTIFSWPSLEVITTIK